MILLCGLFPMSKTLAGRMTGLQILLTTTNK
jgi:hypothetical protein